MSKRNFPNFLDAYYEYAKDAFCPDIFHLWTGISIVAGALERKVWLPWTASLNFYPNLYILLVSHPGMGKSSAGNTGVNGLLRHIKDVKFIPAQVTEAKFIDIMSAQQGMAVGTKQLMHSSGYFYASEASNSLKNIYGDFIACLTDFYDCPSLWEKATQKDDVITLSNVCFNMLAGCTFDYLNKLITDDNIMGGFASRVMYVIHDEKMVRKPSWGSVDSQAETSRKLLMEDLQAIHKMSGPFTATPEFKAKWLEWFPKHDAKRQELASEKLQALLVRKGTNLMKLCMVCAAAEASDRVLRIQHWERAMALVESLEGGIPKMLKMTQSQNGGDDGQRALNMTIMELLDSNGKEMGLKKLALTCVNKGYQIQRVKDTINAMVEGEQLKKLNISNQGLSLRLLVDSNDYL